MVLRRAAARSPASKPSPADAEGADLHVCDSPAHDLTWMACMPNLSTAPKHEGNAGQASGAGASPRKTPCALSVHQGGLRQGRLVVHEVERLLASSEVA
jgi:hypothetical protein